jgi:hypothetical protein
MWQASQASSRGRVLAKEPAEKAQEQLAINLNLIPKTPIIGHALIRLSSCDGYKFLGAISALLPHKRTFLVPISVPGAWQKRIKSGATRCTGPSDETQDRSGVSYIMRTIGHAQGFRPKMKREQMKDSEAAEGAEDDDEHEDEEDEDGDNADRENGMASGTAPTTQGSSVVHEDVDLLPEPDLRNIFGEEVPDAHQVLFQHTARITPEATFANKSMRVMKSSGTNRGEATPYRKGQVHPTVHHEVIRSALRCANVPLSGRECAVILTGGTPDSIIGALMAGYRYVIFVANSPEEMTMMTLPTAAELEEKKVDFARYPETNFHFLIFVTTQ